MHRNTHPEAKRAPLPRRSSPLIIMPRRTEAAPSGPPEKRPAITMKQKSIGEDVSARLHRNMELVLRAEALLLEEMENARRGGTFDALPVAERREYERCCRFIKLRDNDEHLAATTNTGAGVRAQMAATAAKALLDWGLL